MRTLEVELLLMDKEYRLLDVLKNETMNTPDSKLRRVLFFLYTDCVDNIK